MKIADDINPSAMGKHFPQVFSASRRKINTTERQQKIEPIRRQSIDGEARV